MKRNAVIIGSLALNVALIGWMVWQSAVQPSGLPHGNGGGFQAASRARGPGSSSSGDSAAGNPGQEPSAVPVSPPIAAPTSDPKRPRFDWRQVESEDYRTYVANLRSIGCPEQTVQDIVAADIRQAYAARREQAMAQRYRDFKFWQAGEAESKSRAELESKRRVVDEEMGSALRELVGPEVALPSTAADWQRAALGQQLAFLPDDKRDQAESLLLRYAEVDAQIRELAGGHGMLENPAERALLVESYDQKRTELHALLSPAEYEQVELTTSWTAENLRRAMRKFEPTEEEFRYIFNAWRAHDENLAGIYARGEPDPGNQHVFAAIQNALTPERFARYRETWWK